MVVQSEPLCSEAYPEKEFELVTFQIRSCLSQIGLSVLASIGYIEMLVLHYYYARMHTLSSSH